MVMRVFSEVLIGYRKRRFQEKDGGKGRKGRWQEEISKKEKRWAHKNGQYNNKKNTVTKMEKKKEKTGKERDLMVEEV